MPSSDLRPDACLIGGQWRTAADRADVRNRYDRLILEHEGEPAGIPTAGQAKPSAEARSEVRRRPFGGVKSSGLGREGARHGLDEYLELKTMTVAI